MQDTTGAPRPTITPERPIAGDSVEVGLRFTNFGKHAVVGASLVYVVPEDLAFIAGSATVNGHPVEGEPAVGIPLPVVKPGDNIDVRWSARTELAKETENPTLSCMLTMPDGQRVPSERVALNIQREAKLSASSALRHEDLPDGGHRIVVTYTLTNSGSRAANDVCVVVPVPAGCAAASGKEALSERVNIPAQASHELDLEFTHLAGDARTVISLENADILEGSTVAGVAPGGSIELPTSAQLGDLRFTITPDVDVCAGSVVQAAFSITNRGLRAADHLTANFALPSGIEFIAQSLVLNGRPVSSHTTQEATRTVQLGRLGPGSVARVTFGCVVHTVASADTITLRAACGDHEIEAPLSLLPFVEFAPDQNYIDSGETSGFAKGVLPFSVVVTNTGSSASHVRLRAESDRVEWDATSGLTPGIRFDPAQQKLSMTADIGEVRPGEQRRIGAQVKLPWSFGDSDTYEIPIYIQGDPLAEALLSRHVISGRSNVSFQGSTSNLLSHETLRRGQDVPVSFEIRNTGTTIARDVIIDMVMPDDLEIASVHDALFEKSTIHLGDIAPGAVLGIIAAVRFTGDCDGRELRTLRARVRAQRSEAYALPAQDLAVRADAVVGEQRVSIISIGQNLFEVTAYLRNIGDGVAREIWLQTSDLGGYLAGSTTVQGRPVRDLGPEPLLLRKLVLDRINPGQAITIAWKLAAAGAQEPDVRVTFGNTLGPIVTVRAASRRATSARANAVDVFSPIVTVVPDDQMALDTAVFTAPEAAPPLAADMFAVSPQSESEPPISQPAQVPMQEAITPDQQSSFEQGAPGAAHGTEASAAAWPTTPSDAPSDGPLPWGLPDALPLTLDADDPAAAVNQTASETAARESAVSSSADAEVPAPKEDDVFLWGAEEPIDVEAPFGLHYATGVFLQTPWSAARQQLVAQTLRDVMTTNSGWHRHIMAMKVLCAQGIHAESAGPSQPEIVAAFAAVQHHLTRSLGRPRLQMYLRRFYPNSEWVSSLHDEKLGIAIQDFLHLTDPFLTTAPPPVQAGALSGTFKKQPALEQGENVALWSYGILPAFIPTVSADMALGAQLQSYSNLCKDFFQDLHKTDETEVYQTLASATNAALDDRLIELIAHFENAPAEVAA